MNKNQPSHVGRNAAQSAMLFDEVGENQIHSKYTNNQADTQVATPIFSLRIPENEVASEKEIVSTSTVDIPTPDTAISANSMTLPTYGLHNFEPFVDHISEIFDTPKDFAAMCTISALCAACGRNYRSYDGRYYNYPALYMAMIGSSSVNKSAPLRAAYAPISNLDKELYEVYKKEAENTGKDDKKPKRRQLWTSDITPEAVHLLMRDNPQGITGKFDELRDKFDNMNRYNKGDGLSKELSFYMGEEASINRAGTDSFLLSETYFNQIGGLQTDFFAKYFIREDLVGVGYSSRWCFAAGTATKPKKGRKKALDSGIATTYNKNVVTIFREGEKHRDKLFEFSEKAKELLDDFIFKQDTKAYELSIENDNNVMIQVLRKSVIVAERIALLSHAVKINFDGIHNYEINVEAMQYGIDVADYFIDSFAHLLAANTTANISQPKKLTNADILKEIKKRYPKMQIPQLATALDIPKNYIYDVLKES